ncbi:hypothetical protein, partial [Pseudomonas syringae group genomosp. 7]|uniref:hypothetical protein n=1 Tax=Pseudomonas syringae group genomosp. 7 TaxID=251699 RepID=UPI00376FF0F2
CCLGCCWVFCGVGVGWWGWGGCWFCGFGVGLGWGGCVCVCGWWGWWGWWGGLCVGVGGGFVVGWLLVGGLGWCFGVWDFCGCCL